LTRYDGLDAFRALGIFGIVLFHVYHAGGQAWSPSIDALMRLRACSLPIVILISFFVVTRSVLGHPDQPYARFVGRRFWRLGVPCLLWSAIYWFMWHVAGPVLRGGRPWWPPATLWLSGFEHLWFLQFLLLGAIGAFPLVRGIARHPRVRWVAAIACVAVAAAYAVWGRPSLFFLITHSWVEQADTSVRVALRQGSAHAHFVPLGVAAAIAADAIARWHARPPFRVLTIAALAVTLVVHVTRALPGVSRVLYSTALFVVLLRPWPPGSLAWLRPAVRYLYPIYIIHFALARGASGLFAAEGLTATLPGLVAASAAVFVASGFVAAALRRAVPADWFLPLIPVASVPEGPRMR